MFRAVVRLIIIEIFATSVTPYTTVYVHNGLGQPASVVGVLPGEKIIVPLMYEPRYQRGAPHPIQIQVVQQTTAPTPTTKKPKGLWKKMKLAFGRKAEKLGKKAQKLGKNMQKENEE